MYQCRTYLECGIMSMNVLWSKTSSDSQREHYITPPPSHEKLLPESIFNFEEGKRFTKRMTFSPLYFYSVQLIAMKRIIILFYFQIPNVQYTRLCVWYNLSVIFINPTISVKCKINIIYRSLPSFSLIVIRVLLLTVNIYV